MMENSKAVACQVFNYLKQTVSSLADPRKELVNSVCNTVKSASTPIIAAALQESSLVEELNRQENKSQGLLESQKRKQCFSPSQGSKKQKRECGSIVVVHGRTFLLDSSKTLENDCRNLDGETFIAEDPVMRLNSIFNQLLWTLKFLKYNPSKSSEEMLGMIDTLCEGLRKIFVLTRFDCTDKDFRRFLRIADALFILRKSHEDEILLMTMVQINRKVETLFENFLDTFTDKKSNAEGQLKTYGFVSALMYQVKDDLVIRKLLNKLILRVYATTTALWKAYVNCPNASSVKLVNPEDINAFFFYCQLLEVLVTSLPLNSKTHLQETVYQSLIILETDAGSLFSLLPNLAFILYSTILATGQQKSLSTPVSPLKEIKCNELGSLV